MMTNAITTVSNATDFINTVDTLSIEGKKKTINALNNAQSLDDFVDKFLKICDVITMPGVRKSRDARIDDTPCVNVYLIDVDGKAYFSQSQGVGRSVYSINMIWPEWGKDTPEGYIELKCISDKLQNGNTLKSLVLKD